MAATGETDSRDNDERPVDPQLAQVRKFLAQRLQQVESSPESEAVWNEFYDAHHFMIVFLLRQAGIPRHGIADSAQEVWIEVLRRLPSKSAADYAHVFPAWLVRVARSKAANWHRRRKSGMRTAANVRSDASADASESAAVDAPLIAEEEATLVRRGLQSLRRRVSPSTYRVLELRFFEDKSVDECCRELGKARQQVWDRQRRAIAQLRRICGKLRSEASE